MQATALPRERHKCSFGCPILDGTLNGGIPCGFVTEITGESSSAKTQLCLQLSLAVQRCANQGGLHASALYVYTENYFPSSRLQQLAKHQPFAAQEGDGRHRIKRRPLTDVNVNISSGHREGPGVWKRKRERNEDSSAQKRSQIEEEEDDCDPCKHVYVQGLQTPELLIAYLDRAESLLSQPLRMPVRLLVIDSIAALFRADFQFNPKELAGRSALFFTISSKLRRLAEQYDLAVVVTNHVTDYFEPVEGIARDPFPGTGSASGEKFITSGRRVAPALGISWAQCVNVRVFLSRSAGDSSDSIQRSLQVVFAPHVPRSSVNFIVDQDGVKGLPGNATTCG